MRTITLGRSMLEYVAPFQRVVLSQTLWLVVAPLFFGVAWHIASAWRSTRRRAEEPSPRRVGIASVLLTTCATFFHVVTIARHPEGARAFFEDMALGVHIGQLDAGVALWFDSLSAIAGLLSSVVVLLAVIVISARPAAEGEWKVFLWIEIGLAGALLSFLADGVVTMAMGFTLAAIAAGLRSTRIDLRSLAPAAMRGGLSVVALLVGSSLLFWGLAGTWRGEEYAADAPSTYAAVKTGASEDDVTSDEAGNEPTAEGSLWLEGPVGAVAYCDDARSPAIRAPYTDTPFPRGCRALRVHTGAQSNDAVVSLEGLDSQRVRIVRVGPSLSFHEVAALLTIRDRAGAAPFAQRLRARLTPAGVDLVGAALAFFAVASWAVIGLPFAPGSPLPLGIAAVATQSVLGPFLLARLRFLIALSPHMGMAIGVVGAAMVITAAARGLSSREGARPLNVGRVFAAVPVGFAWMVFGLQGAPVGPRRMVDGGLAAALLFLAAGRLPSSRVGHGSSVRREDSVAKDIPFRIERALEAFPDELGRLLVSYERWVVDSVSGAAAGLVVAASWAAAHFDAHVLSAPAQAEGAGLVRARQGLEGALGPSLARWVCAIVVVGLVTLGCFAVIPGAGRR